MAFDAFIKFSTFEGESTDEAHSDGWIEVLSFEHSVSQPSSGSVSSGGGRSSQRTDHGAFTILKAIDKATPKLFVACCRGDHIPTVKLEVCRAGGDKVRYYLVEMEDVLVSQVESSGQAKGGAAAYLPTETVALTYGKITWTYTETDHKTGQQKGDVAGNWDLHINKGG